MPSQHKAIAATRSKKLFTNKGGGHGGKLGAPTTDLLRIKATTFKKSKVDAKERKNRQRHFKGRDPSDHATQSKNRDKKTPEAKERQKRFREDHQ